MAYYGFGSGNRSRELTPAGRVLMVIMGLVFIIMPFMEFNKYAKLASEGKEAEAAVISYNPTYSHSRNGTTTHHWHVLSFDGSQNRIELKRQIMPGTKISIVYDPQNRSNAAEGKKGMSGAELMGNDYMFMWLMLGIAVAIILAAFFAPSKSGGFGSGFQSTGVISPPPESFSGLAGDTEKKTYPYKTTARYTVPLSSAPAKEHLPKDPDSGIGVTQMDSTVPFVPGGPVAVEKASAAASTFSKYGFDVMDAGYGLFKANPDTAAALLADKFGSLTIGQAKDAIAKADALDYKADEEADNVSGGLYTADKAAINLMKTNPGFSEQLYKDIINEKIKSS